jgi:hypothetical protein
MKMMAFESRLFVKVGGAPDQEQVTASDGTEGQVNLRLHEVLTAHLIHKDLLTSCVGKGIDLLTKCLFSRCHSCISHHAHPAPPILSATSNTRKVVCTDKTSVSPCTNCKDKT